MTYDRFRGTIEAQLPQHRERAYPPTETLARFAAQVYGNNSSSQRAVKERLIDFLQHRLRSPAYQNTELSNCGNGRDRAINLSSARLQAALSIDD